MLMGIGLKAHPSEKQKLTLSHWMGCARFVWNPKCHEDPYLVPFARPYLSVGPHVPLDQSCSQYRGHRLWAFLKECPSQILRSRSSTSHWYSIYQDFFEGRGEKPKRKKKSHGGSIHLTRELLHFEVYKDSVTKLFIGTKKKGDYRVWFCYEDKLAQLNLQDCQRSLLDQAPVGIDRGVVRPVQTEKKEKVYDLTREQKRSKGEKEKYLESCQEKLAKQKKGSKGRVKKKQKMARCHEKIVNMRKDFCHRKNKALVGRPKHKIFVLEDFKTQSMTKKPKVKQDENGHWEKNGVQPKVDLHKWILHKGSGISWRVFSNTNPAGQAKLGLKYLPITHTHPRSVLPCSHTSPLHPRNRKSQELFKCESFGHADNANLESWL